MANSWDEFLGCIQGDIRRLDSVIRYNSIPVLQRESVATHTFWVTLYAILIHRHIHKGGTASHVEQEIMLAALTHDLAECVTGDVVRTFKYSNPELKRCIDESEDMMVVRYFPEALKSIMRDSDRIYSSSSGQYVKSIIKAADFTSLFMFMNREWIRGNREITPFIKRMVRDLEAFAYVDESAEWYDKELSHLYHLMSEQALCVPPNREV